MLDFIRRQNPLSLCAFFSLLVAVSFLLGLDAVILGTVLCVLFTGLVFINPQNGIYLLIFFAPFFLGNSKREYYFFFEYCTVVTFLASALYIYRKKYDEIKNIKFNYVYLSLTFIIFSLFLSIPINLKEFYYEVRGSIGIDPVNYIKDQLLLFSYGHEGKNIYYIRTLSNYILSCGLFFVVPFLFERQDIKTLLKCILFSLCVTLLFGYVLYYDVIPHKGVYFCLSFVGKQHNVGMTAFSYNRGYLSQYLILFFPFIFYFMYVTRKNIKSLLFVVLFFVSLKAVVLTTQRTALLIFFVQLFILPFLFLLNEKGKINKKSLIASFSALLVVLMVVVAIDITFLDSQLRERLLSLFTSLGQRGKIWTGAFIMWKNNFLLGVGLGKYHHFFPYYYPKAIGSQLMFERSTAHNLYFHLLAQRGIIGFLAVISFVVILFSYGIISLKKAVGEYKAIIAVLLLSFIGFLGYGMGQYMFYVRSIAVSFWILSGFIYIIAKSYIKDIVVPRSLIIKFIIGFIILLCYRFYTIAFWAA